MQTLAKQMLVGLAALLTVAAAAGADTIRNAQGVPYDGTIIGISEDGLVFRWEINNKRRTLPFGNVERIEIDGNDSLNEAETLFVDGNYQQASGKYQGAKQLARSNWLRQYINRRLVKVFAETEQFAEAVKIYIELAQTADFLARGVDLPEPAPKGSPGNDAALQAVNRALEANPNASYTEQLKQLRLAILQVQGDPAEVLPEVEALLQSSDPDVRQKARLDQIDLLLQLDRVDEAGKVIEQAELEPQYEPQMLFLEGQYLYRTGEKLRAALKFMRLPIHYKMSRRDLAAKGLYWAGRCMAEANVPLSEAAQPLQEAARDFDGTEGAEQARELLGQLQQGT